MCQESIHALPSFIQVFFPFDTKKKSVGVYALSVEVSALTRQLL